MAAVVVVATFGGFAIYIIRLQHLGITQQIAQELRLAGQQAAQSVQGTLNGRLVLTEAISQLIGKAEGQEEISDILKNDVLMREFSSTYLGDESGNFYIWPFSENPPGYDARLRPWYQDAMKADGPVLTEPYIDSATNELMISAAVPTKRAEKFVGVTASDFSLQSLTAMMRELVLPNSGFVFVANRSGQILIHPDADWIGKSLSEYGFTGLSDFDETVHSADLNGEAKLVAMSLIGGLPATDWYLISVMDRSTAYASIANFRLAAGLATALSVIGMLLMLAYALNRVIVRPLNAMTNAMKRIASGELSGAIPGRLRHDQIGQMALAVAVFRDNAVEKQGLEDAAAQSRLFSESEKIERERQREIDNNELQHAIDALGEALDKLANGNLVFRIDKPFADRFEILRQDYNRAVVKLRGTLETVQKNAAAINNGTSEIRLFADQLAQRTQQQAVSVEETAAALQQITTAVSSASERATAVGSLVVAATSSAERSASVVEHTIVAMREIEGSSKQIANIVGIIEEIAFQTNLLALNAGVEAARAGETGKGFAVVAQEVRELAQRSATAANEIRSLIATSENQVRRGVVMVGQTSDALQEIASEVQSVIAHVDAIIASSREQALGLTEVSLAVTAVDQTTQRNAAMVEEQTVATHGLEREVSALSHLLQQFQLGGEAVRLKEVAA